MRSLLCMSCIFPLNMKGIRPLVSEEFADTHTNSHTHRGPNAIIIIIASSSYHHIIILYYKSVTSSVCVCVCVCVCARTPPRPMDGFTSYLVERCISPREVSLSIFHDLRSKVKVTRGHWIYLPLWFNVIEWPVISTILLLETSNLKCRYMRSPNLRFGAWNFIRAQRSSSGASRDVNIRHRKSAINSKCEHCVSETGG